MTNKLILIIIVNNKLLNDMHLLFIINFIYMMFLFINK